MRMLFISLAIPYFFIFTPPHKKLSDSLRNSYMQESLCKKVFFSYISDPVISGTVSLLIGKYNFFQTIDNIRTLLKMIQNHGQIYHMLTHVLGKLQFFKQRASDIIPKAILVGKVQRKTVIFAKPQPRTEPIEIIRFPLGRCRIIKNASSYRNEIALFFVNKVIFSSDS